MKRTLGVDKVIVRNSFLLNLLLHIYIYVIYQYSPPVFFMSTCNKSFLYTLQIYCSVLLLQTQMGMIHRSYMDFILRVVPKDCCRNSP